MAKQRTYKSAHDWPAEIGDVVVGLGAGPGFELSEADVAWAAENLGGEAGGGDLPDEVLERAAGEALAADELERGLKGF